MTTAELIKEVATISGITKKQTGETVETLIQRMTKALTKGDDVVLQGIGKFIVKRTAARASVNPSTGAKINIPAGKKVAFKIHKALKDAIQA